MQRSFFIGSKLGLRREFFFENPKLLDLGRQIGLKTLGGILGIFGQFISTHFGTDSLLSMFSINQPLQWNLDLRKPDLRKNLDLRKIVGTTIFLVHKLFDLRKTF